MDPKDSDAGGQGTQPYRFDEIVVDPAAHLVLRAGVVQPLEPKAFAVLLALLRHGGELVGRDDLLDQVWGHRHVTPGVLTRAIAQLRHALGDDPHEPRYIQTRHALGYCFIGELVASTAAPDPAPTLAIDAPAPAEPVPVRGDDVASAPETLSAIPASSTGTLRPRWPGLLALRRSRVMLAVCALVLAAVMWLAPRPPDTALPPDASVAVLPFSNLSAQPRDDYFAQGLAEEMRDALAGVAGLKVAASVSPAVRAEAADARELGNRLGVATVLEGSVRRDGTRLRITARLSDARSGFTLWSHTYDRQLADVFDTQSDIAARVVHSLLGVMPGPALRQRLAPTRSGAAFDAYLQGLEMLRQVSVPGDASAAIRQFDQALARDSGFARAQAKICRVEIWQFQNSRNADAFRRAEEACAQAAQMDPSLAEVDLALGDLYRVRGDLGRAMAQYLKSAKAPATGASAHVGMAKIYAAQGKGDLALAQFHAALEQSPGDPAVYAQLGYQQYLDGHVPQALASFRKVVALTPDDAQGWSTLGALALDAGDNVEGERALQRAVAIAPDAASLTNLGQLKSQQGEYSAAVELQRQAVKLAPDDFMMWANLGQALEADPANRSASLDAFRQAASRADRYLRLKPDDARACAALGLYRAILGDVLTARQMVQRSEALATQPGEVALLNAQTLALLGDLGPARVRLAAARASGIAQSVIATNLTFRRLGLLAPAAQSAAEPSARHRSAGPSPGG